MKPKEYSVEGLTLTIAEEKLRGFSAKCMAKEVTSKTGVSVIPMAEFTNCLSLRERNGSREVLFAAKARGQGEFREFGGSPVPKFEKIKYSK